MFMRKVILVYHGNVIATDSRKNQFYCQYINTVLLMPELLKLLITNISINKELYTNYSKIRMARLLFTAI